jgi:transcription antitermination factor NusG
MGYECFSPVRSAAESKKYRGAAPLFPGYVFCKFNYAIKWHINTTPGVLYIVSFGGSPAVIDEQEIDRLRMVVHTDVKYSPAPYLTMGSTVVLRAGPLRGLEGIILRCSDGQRLIISISLLQRSVAVEVEREWVDLPREIRSCGIVSQKCA